MGEIRRDGAIRVALISSSYSPHVGGVEEHVRQTASALDHAGFAVEVWTVERSGASAVVDLDGVRVRYLPTPLPAVSSSALARFARSAIPAWRQWVSAHRQFRPDLIHVHCFGPNGVYALALHRRFRTPLVVTSHGETFMDDNGIFGRSALLRASLRRAMQRAKATTAPSRYVLDDLRAHYGLHDGRVIPNGVDMRIVPNPRGVRGFPYFFAVGRLGRMKGFDLLIQAFAAAQLDPAIRLVIGGDGPEHEALAGEIARHQLGERVELVGWMDSQQIADAMSDSLAVVVPSRVEAFGIVALEAWRSSAPLIMTDQGGGPEFVTDGEDGMLVDPTDTAALGDVLVRVASDAPLRASLARAGNERIGEFSWSRVADAYADVYGGVRRGRELKGAG